MVSILEAIEKFPQYLYDVPGGSSFGLQLLNRRIKLRLLQLNANSLTENDLLDRFASYSQDSSCQAFDPYCL